MSNEKTERYIKICGGRIMTDESGHEVICFNSLDRLITEISKDATIGLSAELNRVKEQLPHYPTTMVRYDLSAAETDEAIREKLIELGWTPPAQNKAITDRQVIEVVKQLRNVPMTESGHSLEQIVRDILERA